MQKLLILFAVVFILSCKKDDTKPKTDVIFHVESKTVTPFFGVEIGSGSENHTAINNWQLPGIGSFDTTISVEVGENVYIRAWNASRDWTLTIKTKDNTILATGEPDKHEPGETYNSSTGYTNETEKYSRVIRADAK